MRPRLLDLFCGAGGAAMGYHSAGFEIVGVDIKRQPRYPFPFVQGDALAPPVDLTAFDAIHASPPCQRWSSATMAWGRTAEHPDLYDPVRRMLCATGLPWVIENVEGAPSRHGAVLCGTMFGLGVQRHRTFESSHVMLLDRQCIHNGAALTVTGHSPYWWAQGRRIPASAEHIAQAMGIDWMSRREIVQAVPPAYTEWIGRQLLGQVR